MKLEEKINYEFQCFYLDQMRTSRENIFAHSEEIELKKKIRDELYVLAKNIDMPTEKVLSVQNNLLEAVYCFCKEVKRKNETENVAEAIKCWIAFLMKKRIVQ